MLNSNNWLKSSQEVTLAFTDTDDTGQNTEMTTAEFELESFLANVPTGDNINSDPSFGLITQISDLLKPLQPSSPQSIGEFTRLMVEEKVSDGVAQASANRTPSFGHRAETTKTVKEAKDSSPLRTAKDFAAASAAMAAAAAEAEGLPVEVKKPVKKRIRRQREELLYLRLKVQEMESSLKKIRNKLALKSGSTVVAVNGTPDTERSTSLTSVWKSIANRQYKDRERAEQENRKLKSTLEGQIKLCKSLEKILTEQPVEDMAPRAPHPLRINMPSMPTSCDENAVYARLFSELDVGFDEADSKYDVKKYSAIETENIDVRIVSRLDNVITLQLTGFRHVPFPQKVAARGMWRFASCETTKRQAYFYQEHETSSEFTIARTYGLKIQSDIGSLDYRYEGVLACRERKDRVLILIKGLAKPINFSAAPVNGIRFAENGSIVIAKASTQDGSSEGKWSTIAMSMELKPIFDDDNSDNDFTVGALMNFVIDSIKRNMHYGEEIAASIMMDESQKVSAEQGPSWS